MTLGHEYPDGITAEIDGETVNFVFNKFKGEGSFGFVYLYINPLTGFKIVVKISKTNQSSFTNEAFYLN